eukprot:symbB.v1.2.012198.t1/scaffold835.1/size159100/25
MPSGPALVMEQQWEPVVWRKAAPSGQAAKSNGAVNQARRKGDNVETSKKQTAATNRSSHASVPSARKLDEHAETFRHQTVSQDFKLALQQARLAKQWTQAQLAASVNEKASVVNDYESDEHAETFRHQTVSHDFKLALQQARLAKQWTQAQLAASVNEKASVVNDYESGRAIPNGVVVVKLNRALGVQLPKAR